MKLILHVIVGLRTGGAELMLKRLIMDHRSAVYRHAVVSLTDIGPIGNQLREAGVDVYAVEMKGAREVFRSCVRLYRICKTLRPFVLQTWMYHADFLGGLVGRIAGVKNILWGIRTSKIARTRYVTRALRRTSALLSYIVPTRIICCAHSAQRLHESIGYDARKFVVVPNGFDERLNASGASRDELRNGWGFRPEHVVVGSVARRHPIKGHELFIAAAATVAAQNSEARYLLIGRDVATLSRLVEQTGFPERFVLAGERSDVSSCLAAMDIFCLHSLSEGFPNALGEAMLAGLPCVATDVGDARMLLDDGGKTVAGGDPAKLAHAIGELLRAPQALRDELGKRNRERIRQSFSMVNTVSRFESVYNDLA